MPGTRREGRGPPRATNNFGSRHETKSECRPRRLPRAQCGFLWLHLPEPAHSRMVEKGFSGRRQLTPWALRCISGTPTSCSEIPDCRLRDGCDVCNLLLGSNGQTAGIGPAMK